MKRSVYTGAATNEISFPLGGIGTGSIGLAGNGRLIDWEIFNSPSKGSSNGYTHFAIKAMKDGKCIDARVLNGDICKDLSGQYRGNAFYNGYGYAVDGSTMAGFPHFRECTFIGDYPEGTVKPAIPVPYAQETMHGFEYALAGLLISRGFINEGLTIVSSVRDHYAGYNRNPWNELECGSNYARSMASFALIPILAGMKFDMTRGMLGFDPKINRDNFRSVWSVGSAWGNVRINGGETTLELVQGELMLSSLMLPYMEAHSVEIDGKAVGFSVKDGEIVLDQPMCVRELVVIR